MIVMVVGMSPGQVAKRRTGQGRRAIDYGSAIFEFFALYRRGRDACAPICKRSETPPWEVSGIVILRDSGIDITAH